jgi:hypothetical protein
VTERISNNAASELTASISSGATTCTPLDASKFPSSGNFRITIGAEIMLVTAVAAGVFTITRGVEGTTAAAHAAHAEITHILTAASLAQLISEGAGGGGGIALDGDYIYNTAPFAIDTTGSPALIDILPTFDSITPPSWVDSSGNISEEGIYRVITTLLWASDPGVDGTLQLIGNANTVEICFYRPGGNLWLPTMVEVFVLRTGDLTYNWGEGVRFDTTTGSSVLEANCTIQRIAA